MSERSSVTSRKPISHSAVSEKNILLSLYTAYLLFAFHAMFSLPLLAVIAAIPSGRYRLVLAET